MEKHFMHYLAPGFDRSAVLEELMTEYGEDVWNFAYFLTRRREMADDISQDVFLIAYNRLYTFRGESSVKSWLLSITRNKSLNYLRSAFFRKVVLFGAHQHGDRDEGGATEFSAEQAAMNRAHANDIWATVMSLPVKHREVLVLAYHYDLSMMEIARTLGLSLGTVKSRLFRAKGNMADRMQKIREEEEE
ncbi:MULTISPECIES: sigma-70 family RNA polymerase sigma factor [unclassified Paenibacillus]|uniref:sigma-70 family RNA polymerase sigma factor n=1 Tax=unclassified Paenibacillus TaxID=185978 RepID=UPI0036D2C90D